MNESNLIYFSLSGLISIQCSMLYFILVNLTHCRWEYDKDVSKKLVDHLFSIRNAMDPADAYRLFRGRDAKVEALMRDRGFPVTQ